MNQRNFRICFTSAATIGLLSSLFGCQSNSTSPVGEKSPSSPESVVNVYSARHYDTDAELFARLTQESGIKINVVEGKDDELIERLKTEGANSPADVFITVDAGRLWRAEQNKLFQPIQSQVLTERIPANLRHPQGLWFGLTKRARVIAYRKDKVQPSQLSTYEALAQPQWKGKVCVRSSNNVYNQSLLGSMIASRGAAATETWAKGLVQNFARPPQGGDIDQIKAVAVGECDVAIVNHYYYVRLAESKKSEDRAVAAKVGLFFPNQGDRGTHVNISGVGVVANAPHKEAAIKFIEFLTSPEAQKTFASGNDEYPAVPNTPLPESLKAFKTFKTDTINVSAYGQNSPEAVKIADRVGWK
ncbi:MAG TPA: Fe(3+) ABC transporter substrate-binding protein [Stenomitos sp.]